MPNVPLFLSHDPTAMVTRSRALVAQADRLLATTAQRVEWARDLAQAPFTLARSLGGPMRPDATEASRDTLSS